MKHVFFIFPPPQRRSPIALLKRAWGRNGAGLHQALYKNVQRLGVGVVKCIQCISEGRGEIEQGIIGHKVKRKVCLEQMTCVLLVGEGEGEGEKKKKDSVLFVSKVRGVGNKHGNRVRVSLSCPLSGCFSAWPTSIFMAGGDLLLLPAHHSSFSPSCHDK